jgi:transcription termination factor Rho
VTELQDQIDVLPNTTTSSNPEPQPRAKRRSGSLATMLLPELQALASSMGLPAAKLRKGDLVAAIQAAQGEATRVPVTRAEPATTTRGRTVERGGSAVDTESGASANGAQTSNGAQSANGAASAETRSPRTRRTATRSAGPALFEEASTEPEAAPGVAAASNGHPATAETEESNGRRSRSARNAGSRGSADSARTAPESTEPASNAASANTAPANTAPANTAPANTAPANTAVTSAGRDAAPPDYRNGEPGRNDFRSGEDRNAEPREQQTREPNARNGNARSGSDRNGNDRNGNDRASNGNDRNGNESRNQNRNGNSRNENARNDNDRNGNSRNDNSRNDNVRNDAAEDDDEFGNSRRSRRYRDRRGRLRERPEGGASAARNDVEPTVSDDDVLIPIAGILDNVDDKNSWFIRVNGYFASPDDIYVANSHVRRYNLRRGDAVTGAVKQSRDGERKEKFNPLVRLDTINGVDSEQAKSRVKFTDLTPLYPQERLRLETESNALTTRIIDLVMPIGKGQRALIVSPPKAGKTSVLQALANAISINNPECHLMVVLVDERPEEVTDMQRSVRGEVIASTFDRRPQDHTMIAELAIERAKRLVEMGHDVVVLLDSITRLGRAYNLAAPASGRILSGGVDSTALYPPKRFLGAARNIEDGGSLTIIATALVETGSTMDTVIFEEFKGTGNAELHLDRKIADKRTFPAVDVVRSGTRKEEILMSSEELAVVLKLRRVLNALEPQQGIDLLLDRLKKSRTNIEFLMQISKTAPGGDDRY